MRLMTRYKVLEFTRLLRESDDHRDNIRERLTMMRPAATGRAYPTSTHDS